MKNHDKKNRILLITIPDVQLGFQLAIYNIQSYLQNIPPISHGCVIKTLILKSKTHRRIYGSTYPVFSPEDTTSILEKIKKYNPHIVGFSCYVWNIAQSTLLAKKIKRMLPNIKIVFGGPEASYYATKLLSKYTFIDFVVLDEGEKIFHQLIQGLLFKNIKLNSIEGLYYRSKSTIRITQYPKPLNLSSLPSPFLTNTVQKYKNQHITLETSRGCPFKCAYCSYNIRNYQLTRYFPLERIKNELQHILNNNPRSLDILDDTFNLNEPRAIEILHSIIKYKKQTRVSFFIRADVWLLKPQLVQLFKHVDAYLRIGVQSLNTKTLHTIKRLSNRPILEQNLHQLDVNRVMYELQFIIGLPHDTYDDIVEHIDWVLSFNPKKILFQILRITPETLLQKDSVSLGLHYAKTPPYKLIQSRSMSPYSIRRAYLLTTALNFFYNNHYEYVESIKKLSYDINKPVSFVLQKWVKWNLELRISYSSLLSEFAVFRKELLKKSLPISLSAR